MSIKLSIKPAAFGLNLIKFRQSVVEFGVVLNHIINTEMKTGDHCYLTNLLIKR